MSHQVVIWKSWDFGKCRLPLKRTFCVLIRKIMTSLDRSQCIFSSVYLHLYSHPTVGEWQPLILAIHFTAKEYNITLPQLFMLPPHCPYCLRREMATVTWNFHTSSRKCTVKYISIRGVLISTNSTISSSFQGNKKYHPSAEDPQIGEDYGLVQRWIFHWKSAWCCNNCLKNGKEQTSQEKYVESWSRILEKWCSHRSTQDKKGLCYHSCAKNRKCKDLLGSLIQARLLELLVITQGGQNKWHSCWGLLMKYRNNLNDKNTRGYIYQRWNWYSHNYRSLGFVFLPGCLIIDQFFNLTYNVNSLNNFMESFSWLKVNNFPIPQ